MPTHRKLDLLLDQRGPDQPNLPPGNGKSRSESEPAPRKRIDLAAQRHRPVATAPPAAGTAIGSLCWDSQTDRVFVDDGMAEFFGLRGSDSLGTLEDLTKRIRAGDRSTILSLIRRCMLHGRDFSARVTIEGVDGEALLTFFGTTILADSGRPTRLLLIGDRVVDARTDQTLDAEPPADATAGEARAIASFDMRNSISAILGFTQLLTEEAGLEPEQRRHVEAIGRIAGGMMQIVDNVLAAARHRAEPSGKPPP